MLYMPETRKSQYSAGEQFVRISRKEERIKELGVYVLYSIVGIVAAITVSYAAIMLIRLVFKAFARLYNIGI